MLTITHFPTNAFPSSNRPLSITQKEIFSALLSSTLPLGFSDPNHWQSTSHAIHHDEMQRQPLFDNRQHRAFWQSRQLFPLEFTRWLGQQLLRLTVTNTLFRPPAPNIHFSYSLTLFLWLVTLKLTEKSNTKTTLTSNHSAPVDSSSVACYFYLSLIYFCRLLATDHFHFSTRRSVCNHHKRIKNLNIALWDLHR